MYPLEFLKLPQGKRCLFWWKCLEIRGIRKSKDRDILVTKDLFMDIKNRFPKATFWYKNNKDSYLSFQELEIEIFCDLPWFYGKEDTIKQRAEKINEIYYMSYEDLLAFKKYLNRRKDIEDIKKLVQRKNKQ